MANYATIEQAYQWVSEYMKNKSTEEIDNNIALSNYVVWGNEFQEYYLREEGFEIPMFRNTGIELSRTLFFDIPVPDTKEDFLTVMRLIDNQ